MPLKRVLEPEVMDSAQEAVDYDTMDHREVNRIFVDDLLAQGCFTESSRPPRSVLDVGTGTAQIPIELCRRQHPFQVTGIDMAAEMLSLGRKNVAEAGFERQIVLEHADAKALPYDSGCFDVVMSNSIVHHLPEPGGALAEMGRVLTVDGFLFVRDLLRPDDGATLEHLVNTYAADCNEHQRQLFRQSLHAALTVEEVGELLRAVKLPAEWVSETSDRHWTIAGRRRA